MPRRSMTSSARMSPPAADSPRGGPFQRPPRRPGSVPPPPRSWSEPSPVPAFTLFSPLSAVNPATLTLSGLRAAYASGDLTPADVLTALAAEIESRDPAIGGYLSHDLELALADAKSADLFQAARGRADRDQGSHQREGAPLLLCLEDSPRQIHLALRRHRRAQAPRGRGDSLRTDEHGRIRDGILE